MKKINILDCTLRDGGYVNNWNFKYKNINKIISNLVNSGVEYIECGFFKKNIKYNINKSLFSELCQLNQFINTDYNCKFSLMINYGEYPIEDIPECENKNILFRIAFNKNDLEKSMIYCNDLKNKGYNIFLNPMQTNTYSEKELIHLVEETNNIQPLALTIVDTTGSMKESDLINIYNIIENKLDKNISICFHSHNNLQLSFSNTQCLIKICDNRNLIIDSTILGMGRGAGNLCTEIITQHLNENYLEKYNTIPIYKIIDEQINPIFEKFHWGYSVPYYLAGINNCHPNYIKYLIDKKILSVEKINYILKMIPNDKKANFDKKLIKNFI